MKTLVFVTLLGSVTARAEYRAFELVIATPGEPVRTEVSNLDPVEYRHFYPVPLNAKIGYRATWMCKGNTSWHQPICPNPRPPKS